MPISPEVFVSYWCGIALRESDGLSDERAGPRSWGRGGEEQTSMAAEDTGLAEDISEDPILQLGSGFRVAKLLFVANEVGSTRPSRRGDR
jgi:hypothetical protein